LGALVVACGDDAAPGPQYKTSEGEGPVEMPSVLVDPDGTRWEKVGPAKISDSKIQGPQSRRSGVERDYVAELSVEELAARIRPEMETRGYVYLMHQEDTLTLARKMKENHDKPVDMPGARAENPENDVGSAGDPLQGRVDGIYDGESRTQIFSSAYPWNNIARYSSTAGRCTAFKMSNHYTGITAAHCLKDTNDNWMARGSFTFSAGTSGVKPSTGTGCYDRIVPAAFDGDEDDLDYGVIRFRDSDTACSPSSYDFGYFGYKSVDGCTTSVATNHAGYPGKNPQAGAAPPGSWTEPALFFDYRGNGWTSCGTYPSALWLYTDSSPGMSGGPVWSYYSADDSSKIRGIMISIWSGVFDDSNRAVKIRSDVIDFIQANDGS
jgi:V8-like Glu-specific endopeptidase